MVAQPARRSSTTARCCSPACRTTCARRSRGCGSAVELGGRDEALKAAWSTTSRRWTGSSGSSSTSRAATRRRRSSRADPSALVAAAVDRYARAGSDVRFVAGGAPAMPLKATAFSRLVTNLVDNALKYGAPPVEVTTRVDGDRFVLDVADRGPGVDPADVARLKQPFTRANAARIGRARRRRRRARARHRRAHRAAARGKLRPAAARGRRRARARPAPARRAGRPPDRRPGRRLSRLLGRRPFSARTTAPRAVRWTGAGRRRCRRMPARPAAASPGRTSAD